MHLGLPFDWSKIDRAKLNFHRGKVSECCHLLRNNAKKTPKKNNAKNFFGVALWTFLEWLYELFWTFLKWLYEVWKACNSGITKSVPVVPLLVINTSIFFHILLSSDPTNHLLLFQLLPGSSWGLMLSAPSAAGSVWWRWLAHKPLGLEHYHLNFNWIKNACRKNPQGPLNVYINIEISVYSGEQINCYRWAPSAPQHEKNGAEKWIITLNSSCSAPWREEMNLQEKARQAFSNLSLNVQKTQNLATCNPSSGGKTTKAGLSNTYLCAQWHLSFAKPTPFILMSSRHSFKSLLVWQPNKQQGMCTWKKIK